MMAFLLRKQINITKMRVTNAKNFQRNNKNAIAGKRLKFNQKALKSLNYCSLPANLYKKAVKIAGKLRFFNSARLEDERRITDSPKVDMC